MTRATKSPTTASARKLVDEVLNMMKGGLSGFSAEKVQRMFRDASKESTLLEAARERLYDDDSETRCLAGVFVLRALRELPEEVDPGIVALAEDVLGKQLLQAQDLLTLKLCEYLRAVEITPTIARSLRHIAESDTADFVVVVSAATAVAPWEERRDQGRVRQMLYHYIEHPRVDVRTVSAIGLLRLPERSPVAVEIALKSFETLEPNGQVAFLKALMDGVNQPEAFRDLVRNALGNPKFEPLVRYFAAKAVRSVFSDVDEAAAVLIKFLHRTSAEYEAMAAAVDALRETNRLPAAASALLRYRDHADNRVRCAAARGLSLGAPVDCDIASEVSSWLSSESDVDAGGYLAGCLSQSGRVGVEALANAIGGETNFTKFDLIARSIGYAGNEGIDVLVHLLDPALPEPQLRVIISALISAGPRAASAAPRLCEIVETTTDYELCMGGLICLIGLGPSVPGVTATLLRVISGDVGDEDVLANWSTIGLLLRRSEAIPAAQAALENATGESARRLRNALAVLSGGLSPHLAYLETADAETLLRRFVQIATVLESGDVKSIKIAVALQNKPLGRRGAKGKRWVENSARRDIDKLGRRLGKGFVLINTVPQQGTWLTPAGRKVLRDARAYFAVKLGRVGD